jgi:hypothetical protein
MFITCSYVIYLCMYASMYVQFAQKVFIARQDKGIYIIIYIYIYILYMIDTIILCFLTLFLIKYLSNSSSLARLDDMLNKYYIYIKIYILF